MFFFKFNAVSRSTNFQVQRELRSNGVKCYFSQSGTDFVFTWSEMTPPQFITDRFGWENECKLLGPDPSLPNVGRSEDYFNDPVLGRVKRI